MKEPRSSFLYESPMSISRKSFGKHVSNIMSGFYFLYFYLTTLDEILDKAKDLETDPICFDEASPNLSNTSNIVFVNCGRFAILVDLALPCDDLVHVAKPYGFSGGLVEGYELRMMC